MICITKELLGTDCNLIQYKRNGKFAWVTAIPEDAWTFGASTVSFKSIEELAFSVMLPLPAWPSNNALRKSFDEISYNGIVKWHYVMSKTQFCDEISKLFDSLWNLLSHKRVENYLDNFIKTQHLLTSIDNLRINTDVLKSLLESEKIQQDVLRSFIPDENDVTKKVRYSRMTSTGRVKHCNDSPQILRLKKDYRTILKSKYNGRLLQADYSSVEPRLLSAIMNINLGENEDIYEFVKNNIVSVEIDRSLIKTAVMGILYGISSEALSKLLPNLKISIEYLIKCIRNIFLLDDLEERLQRMLNETGYIITIYGRYLKPKRTDKSGLVSYYIQGSAVDLCLNGFKKICDYIKEKELQIMPMFLIHDGLFLDISTTDVNDITLQYVIKQGTLEYNSKVFPLTVKSIF